MTGYERAMVVWQCVARGLWKAGGPAKYASAEGLYILLADAESVIPDVTYYEVMEALRQVEPALHAATVGMLVELYFEAAEDDQPCREHEECGMEPCTMPTENDVSPRFG